jgi:hypothetical protein
VSFRFHFDIKKIGFMRHKELGLAIVGNYIREAPEACPVRQASKLGVGHIFP